MLIGLMGKMGAGKTSVAKAMHRQRAFEHHAFGNSLKGMLVKAGLIRKVDLLKKPPQTRWLLQRIGTDLVRDQIDPDFWVKKLDERIVPMLNQGVDIVIDDIRFFNEANYVKNHGGYLFLIVRPDHDIKSNHRSETELESISPTGIIMNDADMPTLIRRGFEMLPIIREIEKQKRKGGI